MGNLQQAADLKGTFHALVADVFQNIFGVLACGGNGDGSVGLVEINAVGVGQATQRSVIVNFLLILMFGYMVTRICYR
jgi:ABC-type transporter Mla maintaining outer membrane lipid asymmetry permease subunit MlaE